MPNTKGTLWIYRGLPGSGKSTIAARVAKAKQCEYFETDMWLYEFEDQDYYWTPERLSVAIDKCHAAVTQQMMDSEDAIVTGVFRKYSAIKGYIELAQEYNYNVVVIEQRGFDYGNIHDVPKDSLEAMKKNFVPNEQLPPLPNVEYKVNASIKGN
jgi:hypothetical protein